MTRRAFTAKEVRVYFPVLNASRAELNGFIDALTAIQANGKIRPLFIPTKQFGLNLLQRSILGKGIDVFVMINPHHGPFHQTPIPLVSLRALTAQPGVIPTMRVGSRSTPAQVAAFVGRYNRRAFILHERVSAHVDSAIAASSPEMVFVRRRRGGNLQQGSPIGALGRARNCEIGDYFQRQTSSALYPPSSDFSDRHLTIAGDPDYGSSGDFSVIGDHYSEGGSQPFAIAVHYIHCNGSYRTAPLRVAHYVSTRNRNVRGDTAGKVQEACALLTADNPRLAALESRNVTAATAEFAIYANPATRTNGERMKRIAVYHHMLLMSAIY